MSASAARGAVLGLVVVFSTNTEHSRQNVSLKAYFGQDGFQFAQMDGWGHTVQSTSGRGRSDSRAFLPGSWLSGGTREACWHSLKGGYRGGLTNVINLAWSAIPQPLVLHIDFSIRCIKWPALITLLYWSKVTWGEDGDIKACFSVKPSALFFFFLFFGGLT